MSSVNLVWLLNCRWHLANSKRALPCLFATDWAMSSISGHLSATTCVAQIASLLTACVQVCAYLSVNNNQWFGHVLHLETFVSMVFCKCATIVGFSVDLHVLQCVVQSNNETSILNGDCLFTLLLQVLNLCLLHACTCIETWTSFT